MLQDATTAADLSNAASATIAERTWTTALRGEALVSIAVVVCSTLAGALYTYATGEDVNWDWQNYHEYELPRV